MTSKIILKNTSISTILFVYTSVWTCCKQIFFIKPWRYRWGLYLIWIRSRLAENEICHWRTRKKIYTILSKFQVVVEVWDLRVSESDNVDRNSYEDIFRKPIFVVRRISIPSLKAVFQRWWMYHSLRIEDT